MEAPGAKAEKPLTRATALLYHDVVPGGCWEMSGFAGAGADVYKMDCEDFRKHLEAIRAQLAQPPVAEVNPLRNAEQDPPFLLTFDDGGVSALLYIADMLDELHWKAYFLMTAGRTGTAGFLDAAQLRELRRRGHIVGSHSYSHPPRMSYCSEARLNEEWKRSTDELSQILGEAVEVASVPGGFYSQMVAVTAAGAGIKLLFNSEPVTAPRTVEGCLVLGRFSARRGHTPEWASRIVRGDRTLMAREYLFWNGKKVAKALLGGAWLRARVRLLENRAKRAAR
jgi:peptidoglycan/xylan/chitin deacetylase (PgdA/CDA1 family)